MCTSKTSCRKVLLVILYFRVVEEKRSVQVEIIKGSKKVKFTISDIVDMIPIKRGHEVQIITLIHQEPGQRGVGGGREER
ncbi:hypothetical protein Syun_021341 [Stephania yunnanensis]|uniref:Uncharacterized protein n=1 Tax=Stephania yunnanensis TaxID=152371 RepID=A0AAP0IFG7_9MAGN